jgi:hypothetical protein
MRAFIGACSGISMKAYKRAPEPPAAVSTRASVGASIGASRRTKSFYNGFSKSLFASFDRGFYRSSYCSFQRGFLAKFLKACIGAFIGSFARSSSQLFIRKSFCRTSPGLFNSFFPQLLHRSSHDSLGSSFGKSFHRKIYGHLTSSFLVERRMFGHRWVPLFDNHKCGLQKPILSPMRGEVAKPRFLPAAPLSPKFLGQATKSEFTPARQPNLYFVSPTTRSGFDQTSQTQNLSATGNS